MAGERLRIEMRVPAGRTRPAALLPLFRTVADEVVGIATKAAAAAGQTISCTKGCGACCRQLVPISAIEARRIRELVDQLPEPRRSEIRARFASATARLDAAGLLAALRAPGEYTGAELRALGLQYFAQGVACPFLEDESCSIHAERPVACREYLVTSLAEHCAQPSADNVTRVKVPAKVARAVRELEPAAASDGVGWVPLIVALEWAEAHPDRSQPRSGQELAREFFTRLRERKP